MKDLLLTFFLILLLTGCDDSIHDAADSSKYGSSKETLANVIKLEEALNVQYGFGTFGDLDGTEEMISGNLLRTKYNKRIYDLYNFGDSLISKFDSGLSGPMSNGKYIRIVEFGKNIVDPSGLALTPVMQSFVGGVKSPPGGECYIDVLNGQFALPRPNYWSKCETLNNLISAELHDEDPSYTLEQIPQVDGDDGKLGNSIQVLGRESGDRGGSIYLSPFAETTQSKGTLSVWIASRTSNTNYGYTNQWKIKAGNMEVEVYCDKNTNSKLYIKVDGDIKSNNTINFRSGNYDEWHHLYVVWDEDKSLTGDQSVMVYYDNGYVNGIPDNIDTSTENFEIKIKARTDASESIYTRVWTDNLKIWKYVVSEGPSWIYDYEYNGGEMGSLNSRENALHIIYGENPIDSTKSYQPILEGPGNGVGYYY